MKRMFDVGLGRVQLWRDELPEASYDGKEILVCDVPAAESRSPRAALAIEVWMPVGPRALYGLLGVRFEPRATGLSIQVPVVSGIEGPRCAHSIASLSDEVRVGLPDEYGHEVVHGLADQAEKLGVGAGVLTIERAAHGLVGSSRSTFAALAILIVRLLAERFDDREAAAIGDIVRDTMFRRANRTAQ